MAPSSLFSVTALLAAAAAFPQLAFGQTIDDGDQTVGKFSL